MAEENIERLIKIECSIGKLWGLRILSIQEKETEKVGSLSELVDMLNTVKLYEIVVYNHFILTRSERKQLFIGWTW